jgi:hypothetical protein
LQSHVATPYNRTLQPLTLPRCNPLQSHVATPCNPLRTLLPVCAVHVASRLAARQHATDLRACTQGRARSASHAVRCVLPVVRRTLGVAAAMARPDGAPRPCSLCEAPMCARHPLCYTAPTPPAAWMVLRTSAASAPGLTLPLPHLRRDWARRCHICAETGVRLLAVFKQAERLPLCLRPGLLLREHAVSAMQASPQSIRRRQAPACTLLVHTCVHSHRRADRWPVEWCILY